MTTPTLPEILQRLRDEPEWGQMPHSKGVVATVGAIRKHNATRARLLAVVDVLSGIIPALNNSPDTTEELHAWITKKLAAALKL